MNPDASLFLFDTGEIVAVVDDIDVVAEHVTGVLGDWIDNVQRLLAAFHDEIAQNILLRNKYCPDHNDCR